MAQLAVPGRNFLATDQHAREPNFFELEELYET
jgi:hypothetical protein